jgi:hypothetical protein
VLLSSPSKTAIVISNPEERANIHTSVVAARNARSFFFLSSVIECGLL